MILRIFVCLIFLWSGVHGNAARSAKASELNDLSLRRLQQDEVVYEQFKRDVLPSLSTAIDVGELAIPPDFWGVGRHLTFVISNWKVLIVWVLLRMFIWCVHISFDLLQRMIFVG